MLSGATLVLSPRPCGIRRERALVKLRSLQHVSSPYPEGEDASVRRFYGEVLGLREKPTPSTLAGMSLVSLSPREGLVLHFFPGPPDLEATRHLCFYLHHLQATPSRPPQPRLAPLRHP